MNSDFSSTLGSSQKNNYYKYAQQGYAGATAQNPYGMQASVGSYGAYPGYYDYSAYNYQPYYQQSNQYAYPFNYQTQMPGYDQNSQYQQLLMQSLATQQAYPQGAIPSGQATDLNSQYQQSSGYPGTVGYGYDYSQNMYQINPQGQMPMAQVNSGAADLLMMDKKPTGEEKK